MKQEAKDSPELHHRYTQRVWMPIPNQLAEAMELDIYEVIELESDILVLLITSNRAKAPRIIWC